MNKKIKIGRRSYTMRASSLSVILYSIIFKRDVYDDLFFILKMLEIVEKKRTLSNEELLMFKELIEILKKIAWTMCYCSNNKITSYNCFCKRIKNNNWLWEVIDHFCSNFNDVEDLNNSNSTNTLISSSERITIHELVAILKRYGFSFEEMNEIRYIDLIKILNTFNDSKIEKTRKATQEDFDRF